MAKSHVSKLLRELINRTLTGELYWKRSTEDQVFSESIRDFRVVLTRRDQTEWTLLMQITGHNDSRPIRNITLTVHPISEDGKVAEASIVVDSLRLIDHRPLLHNFWRYAQEAADVPVMEVVNILNNLGAKQAADEIVRGRKNLISRIEESEMDRDDE